MVLMINDVAEIDIEENMGPRSQLQSRTGSSDDTFAKKSKIILYFRNQKIVRILFF